MKKIILLLLAIISITSCTPIYKKMNIDKDFYNGLQDGVYAKMETSKGELIIKFFDKDAPVTVANFVGLAEGTIENKAKAKGVPYYDGIVFHRVIKNFMIQGGDPQGTGMGDPGYKFDDEKNNLKHEGKGYLPMAIQRPIGCVSTAPLPMASRAATPLPAFCAALSSIPCLKHCCAGSMSSAPTKANR
jgi:hypothetical protein